jgi:aminopeptidase 2
MASAFVNETEYPVWQGLLTNLYEALGFLNWEGSEKSDRDEFVLRLIRNTVQRLGWEPAPNEDSNDVRLRPLLLGSAIAHGDAEAIQEALRRFHFGGPIDPNLLGTVLSAVARHGGPEGYETLLTCYRAANDAETKVKLLSALGQARATDLKRRTLEFAFSDEVRKQDAITPVNSAAGGKVGARLAWAFIKERWAEINARYQGNNAKIGYFMRIAAHLADSEGLADAREFFASHPVEGLDMIAAQSLERIEINCRWREQNATALAEWLAAQASR